MIENTLLRTHFREHTIENTVLRSTIENTVLRTTIENTLRENTIESILLRTHY